MSESSAKITQKTPVETAEFDIQLYEVKMTSTCLKPCMLRWSRFWNHVFYDGWVSKSGLTLPLWEAEARHARELSVLVLQRALLYTGSPPLKYSDLPVRPALPGSVRTCESSRPDSKPIPHAQVLCKAVAWQSTNSLKLYIFIHIYIYIYIPT